MFTYLGATIKHGEFGERKLKILRLNSYSEIFSPNITPLKIKPLRCLIDFLLYRSNTLYYSEFYRLVTKSFTLLNKVDRAAPKLRGKIQRRLTIYLE